MSVLLGALFLGAALACAKGWRLEALAIYAFLAGLGAIVFGVRILDIGLSQMPALAAAGFFLTGGAGVLSYPALALRSNRSVRLLGALVVVAAAGLWAFTAFAGIWFHMAGFQDWKPLIMQMPVQPPAVK